MPGRTHHCVSCAAPRCCGGVTMPACCSCGVEGVGGRQREGACGRWRGGQWRSMAGGGMVYHELLGRRVAGLLLKKKKKRPRSPPTGWVMTTRARSTHARGGACQASCSPAEGGAVGILRCVVGQPEWARLAQPGEEHRRRHAWRRAAPPRRRRRRAPPRSIARSPQLQQRVAIRGVPQGMVLQRQAAARRTFPAEEVPSSSRWEEPRRTLAAARAAGGVRSAQPALCRRLPAVRAPLAATSGRAAAATAIDRAQRSG